MNYESRLFLSVLLTSVIAGGLSACGQASSPMNSSTNLPPVGVNDPGDGSIIHGQAVYVVSSEQQSESEAAVSRLLDMFRISSAFATVDNNTTVTYTNSPSTSFQINTQAFQAGSFSGTTLSLGSFSVSGLNDNNLSVCGTNGTTKCTTGIIRVYTTGSIAGFVNTAGGYGAPVFTGTLNPTTQVGLVTSGTTSSAVAVQVETYTIPSSTHVLTLSDFPSPTYAVTSDFANAGSGSYSMTYVVEYALQ